jgi:hypothetical protein
LSSKNLLIYYSLLISFSSSDSLFKLLLEWSEQLLLLELSELLLFPSELLSELLMLMSWSRLCEEFPLSLSFSSI